MARQTPVFLSGCNDFFQLVYFGVVFFFRFLAEVILIEYVGRTIEIYLVLMWMSSDHKI